MPGVKTQVHNSPRQETKTGEYIGRDVAIKKQSRREQRSVQCKQVTNSSCKTHRTHSYRLR